MANVQRTKTWVSGDVLTASDLNAEFNGLLGALALVNADISAGAAIAYSKLALTGAILNADLAGSIAASKISDTAVTLTATQTLTNKTLTNPVINYTDTTITTNVKARAYRSAAQTLSDNVDTKVQLETESYDVGADFDSVTNYRFVAPVSGYYHVAGNARFAGGTVGYRAVSIRVNNTAVLQEAGLAISATVSPYLCPSGVVYLAATDYVELFAYQNNGGDLTIANGVNTTFLTVHLLSV